MKIVHLRGQREFLTAEHFLQLVFFPHVELALFAFRLRI
jgi:hypothetical protein